MAEIRTPQGVRRDLEQEMNVLMSTYEKEHGLEIQRVYFCRERLSGSGRNVEIPKVNLTVRVPK